MTARPEYKKYIRYLWFIALGGVLLFLLMLGMAAIGAFGSMPSLAELENPKNNLATEVYSSDGVLLGKYYFQNRSPITFEEIPPMIRNCLISTEDVRFYEHSGIDFRGQFDALFSTLTGDKRGGSTITQQLAKNLFPRPENGNVVTTVLSKFKEWIIAIEIERRYTKNEIIDLYLQTVQFSENAYGIKSAAFTYFNKPLDSLHVDEAAVLIGMLKGITIYNPKRHPDNAMKRRNVVMSQMVKSGFLKTAEFDSLKNKPIKLDYQSPDHNEGLATYFREYLRQYLMDYFKNNPKPDGSTYNIYKDGLKVYTTINSKVQQNAEDAVQKHMAELQAQFNQSIKGSPPWGSNNDYINNSMQQCDRWVSMKKQGVSNDSIIRSFHTKIPMTIFSYHGDVDTVMSPYDSLRYYKCILQTGFMAMDPSSGYILAWVGGINHHYFQYDHVNQEAKRQVGSTIKPILYTVAVDNGFSPCMQVPNERVVFENYQDWSPENVDGKYGDTLSLFQGLAMSVNCVSAYLMKQIGPQPMIDYAKRLGITSDIPPYPSICLGTPDISLYEMVGAYSTFANKGVYTQPQFLLRIEDKNGKLIKEFNTTHREAISEGTAYVMVKMLENVVNSGTAARLRFAYSINNEIGGKTGTTQNNTDGWFIGITPQIAAGCWVGGEDRIIRFKSTFYGQGANMALPTYAYFLKKCYHDPSLNINPAAHFSMPSTPLPVEIDCSQYLPADTIRQTDYLYPQQP